MTHLLSELKDVETPYAVFVGPQNLEQRVLQAYEPPEDEDKNPRHAAWFIAGRSDGTFGRWEYGDTYRENILDTMHLKYASPEFIEAYRNYPFILDGIEDRDVTPQEELDRQQAASERRYNY